MVKVLRNAYSSHHKSVNVAAKHNGEKYVGVLCAFANKHA